MADHSLTLGDLDLTDGIPDADHDFRLAVVADGASFGAAQDVREVVLSLLADGDHVRTTRAGNREVTFAVEVTGPDLASVAHGEAALRREVGVGNTLTWQPPDSLAPASVFEVVTSGMESVFNDLDEMLRRKRTFRLSFECAPRARSLNPVDVEALVAPGTATTLTVNDANATTGWSGHVYAATTGVRSSVAVTDMGSYMSTTADGATLRLTLWLDSPFALTLTPYLLIQSSGTKPAAFNVYYTDGTSKRTTTPAHSRAIPGGLVEYGLEVDATKTLQEVYVEASAPYGSATLTLAVHDVSATDALPQVSPRQVSRIIEGRGTERTPGSIHVKSPVDGDDLGVTIVHTCPEDVSGYSPPLRRWRTGGNAVTTETTTTFSGAYEDLEPAAFVAEVPNSALPHGDYLLAARIWSSAAATVTVSWAISTIVNSSPQDQVIGDAHIDWAAPGFVIAPLAILSLPTVRSLGPVTQVSIITGGADGVTNRLDEGWLFRMGDDCGLTIVNNPTDNLWLDSPDITSPVPRVWIGDINDRSDARHPSSGLESFGSHVILPEGTALFTAAMVDNPEASAQFYPRWHSNAAE